MNRAERLRLLALRCQALVQRAAQQCLQLGRDVAPLLAAWTWVERAGPVWQSLRRRPWLLVLPAALLLWWRPRGALGMVSGVSALWRGGRAIQALLRRWCGAPPCRCGHVEPIGFELAR